MKKVIVLLSEGYEETEALLVVTYLRRANIFVDMVATEGSIQTYGSHCIPIRADKMLADIQPEEYAAIVTPGGIPGAEKLAANQDVINLISDFYQQGKIVASICASPIVLKAAGITAEIEGVCYPGFEEQVEFKKAHSEIVYVDRNVITSRGPLTAPFFALSIIQALEGKETAQNVANQILFPLVKDALTNCTCFS